jgi:hypothetical protein
MYLKALSGHENIIQLLDVFIGMNGKDLYLIFETMETDLHVSLLQTRNLFHSNHLLFDSLFV